MTVLYDQFDRPIKRTELLQRHAEPGLTSVRQAWSQSIATGMTPVRLAGILQACNDGNIIDFLTLAEEMEERDPHYGAVLGVRKRAVSGVEALISPASEDPNDIKIADETRRAIAEHDQFADLVEDMLDALGKGFSVVEIDWKTDKSNWWPRSFVRRDPKFFFPDREQGQEIRLLDEADLTDGLELAPYRFITHKSRQKSGQFFRTGLARLVAFNWICKAYTMKDWMAFIETFGLPLRMGKYGPGATPEDVEKLFLAVANIGTDAAAVLPQNMTIDLEAVANGPGNDIFEKFARWGDEQVSKAVLGQTMTSDNGSSMAQANVHNDVRLDIAISDARSVAGSLNRDLIKPFVDLNYGVQKAYPRLTIPIEEPEDLNMVMQNVFRLASQGTRFKQSEIRQRMGFSEPDADDEVIGGEKLAKAKEKPIEARNRQMDLISGGLEDLSDQMASEWEDVLGNVLTPILDLLQTAETYADAQDVIAQAFPQMDSSKLIDTLVQGAVMARADGDAGDNESLG